MSLLWTVTCRGANPRRRKWKRFAAGVHPARGGVQVARDDDSIRILCGNLRGRVSETLTSVVADAVLTTVVNTVVTGMSELITNWKFVKRTSHDMVIVLNPCMETPTTGLIIRTTNECVITAIN